MSHPSFITNPLYKAATAPTTPANATTAATIPVSLGPAPVDGLLPAPLDVVAVPFFAPAPPVGVAFAAASQHDGVIVTIAHDGHRDANAWISETCPSTQTDTADS